MPEPHVFCPSCDVRIRFRSGLPREEWILCPRCGEEIRVEAPSARRRPPSRRDEDDFHDYDDAPPARRQRPRPAPAPTSSPRRAVPPVRAERAPARQPKGGGNAGLWVGLIGGAIGVLGLIIGLVFFLNTGDDPDAPADNAQVADGSEETNVSTPNEARQFVANFLPGQAPLGGPAPVPEVAPGPDGVIPAPPAQAGQPAANVSHKLKYGWRPGQEFAYRVDIKAEVGDTIDHVLGTCNYQVLANDPALARLNEEKEEQEASGTGFVVHSEGFLVTCAHVIEDAKTIQVHLGGKTYAARVIEINSKRDLALIRISARNLPALPLGNSGQVQLAENVRVVGYPLSSVLGESVKITQGSVAGFIDRHGERTVQVDASINPGNSGGPLVNDRGQVIGVASAIYAGAEISEVGLAVPSNDVEALLRKNGVTANAQGSATALAGPELARRVTPSVAFLKVTVGPSQQNRLALQHSGSFSSHKSQKDGRLPVGGLPDLPKSSRGKLVVNEYGEILDSDKTESLPYVLGPLAHLAIEPLSSDGQSNWAVKQVTTLTQVKRDTSRFDPYSPFGRSPRSRFGRPGFGPRGIPRPGSPFGAQDEPEVKIHVAFESNEYELADSTPQTQVIKKQYEFRTVGGDADRPYLRLTGGGTIRFDRATSMPDQINYQLTLSIRGDDGSVIQAPITVTCERVSAQELADSKKRAAEALANAQAKRAATPPAQPAAPLTPQQVATLDDHLTILKDPAADFSKKYTALNALKRLPPEDSQRKKVCDVLEPLLKDANPSLQRQAIDVFSHWGTEDRTAELIRLLGSGDSSIRRAVIKALGKIGGKNAAEAVAQRLTDTFDRNNAGNALKEMGPEAEDPALKLVDHPEEQVRYQVYQILGKVGGEKSRKVLEEKAKTEPNGFIRAAASIALRELQK